MYDGQSHSLIFVLLMGLNLFLDFQIANLKWLANLTQFQMQLFISLIAIIFYQKYPTLQNTYTNMYTTKKLFYFIVLLTIIICLATAGPKKGQQQSGKGYKNSHKKDHNKFRSGSVETKSKQKQTKKQTKRVPIALNETTKQNIKVSIKNVKPESKVTVKQIKQIKNNKTDADNGKQIDLDALLQKVNGSTSSKNSTDKAPKQTSGSVNETKAKSSNATQQKTVQNVNKKDKKQKQQPKDKQNNKKAKKQQVASIEKQLKQVQKNKLSKKAKKLDEEKKAEKPTQPKQILNKVANQAKRGLQIAAKPKSTKLVDLRNEVTKSLSYREKQMLKQKQKNERQNNWRSQSQVAGGKHNKGWSKDQYKNQKYNKKGNKYNKHGKDNKYSQSKSQKYSSASSEQKNSQKGKKK